MKKSLIALAVLAAAGSASAQSSVTLFGIVDATLAWGRGSVADRFQLTNSGYNSSRLGFRGVEDLGGGMSASFWLEAGVNNDNGTGAATNVNNQATGGGATGTCTVAGATPAVVGVPVTCASTVAPNGTAGLTFNRRSTVSLSGGWGEVRLGRDIDPQFWTMSIYDAFGTNGVGTTQILNSTITGVTAVRASNMIQYFLPPNLGGFYGQVAYYLGENLQTGAATEKDGRGYGLRVGFASGPFDVSAGYGRTDYAAGDIVESGIGGSWNFGVAKVMGSYEMDKAGTTKGRGWQLGGSIPVGPGEVRVAYSRYTTDIPVGADPRTNKWALGYVHNLSKRTALYATYAHVSNNNGAAASLNGAATGINSSSSGVDLGIRHSF